MSSVLTAILGGAIGFLLGALARALGIPGGVRAHNAAVRDRDDQLATWTADRDYVPKRECKASRERFQTLAGANSEDAKSTDRYIADLKASAIHEWRDAARLARLDVATILAAEGWAHRVYRRLTKRPPPILTTPEKATPVLDGWRGPSSLAVEHTYPDDATKRTLDDAINTMPATGP